MSRKTTRRMTFLLVMLLLYLLVCLAFSFFYPWHGPRGSSNSRRVSSSHVLNQWGGHEDDSAFNAWGGRFWGRSDSTAFGGQWGYYTDSETGLVLCTQRYYDPNAQRWVTRDPIGYAGGINLYGYVRNNPVGYVDPDGQYLVPLVMAFGIAAVLLDQRPTTDPTPQTVIDSRFDPFAQEAMTIPGTATTYYGPLHRSLLPGWRASVEIHERVHHAQHDNFGLFCLPNNKEREAYTVEKRYLIEGLRRRGPLGKFPSSDLIARLKTVDGEIRQLRKPLIEQFRTSPEQDPDYDRYYP
jgi:RHS repeat-associated protein